MPLPSTLDEAIAFERRGRRLKYVHFWNEKARPDGTAGRGCLSQWWPSTFTDDGHRYRTAEHYMMARKAWLFGDTETAERILAAGHPAQVKLLGREVRGFDQATWEAERFGIVVQASVLKFGQNPALLDYLRGTAGRVLVEASPKDRIWGIGLAETDPGASSPAAWRGLNLLGFALMDARAQLTA
jgi:ribA/ribD-fused uncharacterized protein